jgi:hypothetical protein
MKIKKYVEYKLKRNAITLLVVTGVTLSLALGMPLFADQSKKQNEPGAEAKKIELPKQKAVKPLPEATTRLVGPVINEFSCASLTGGYNINLFRGPAVSSRSARDMRLDLSPLKLLQVMILKGFVKLM